MRSEKISWILATDDVVDWLPFLSDVTNFDDSLIFSEVLVFGDISEKMIASTRESLNSKVSLLLLSNLQDALQQSSSSALCFMMFPDYEQKVCLSKHFDEVFSIVVHRDTSFSYCGQDADLFFDGELWKNRSYSLRSFLTVVCHDFRGLVNRNKENFTSIVFEDESDISIPMIRSVLFNLSGTGCWDVLSMAPSMNVTEKKRMLRCCDVFVPSSLTHNYWKEFAIIENKLVFDKVSCKFIDLSNLLPGLFSTYQSLSVKNIIHRILLRNSVHAHANCWKY